MPRLEITKSDQSFPFMDNLMAKKKEKFYIYKMAFAFLLGLIVSPFILFAALCVWIWKIFLIDAFYWLVNTGQDLIDWLSERYHRSEK